VEKEAASENSVERDREKRALAVCYILLLIKRSIL
jgi:hypothetical protein